MKGKNYSLYFNLSEKIDNLLFCSEVESLLIKYEKISLLKILENQILKIEQRFQSGKMCVVEPCLVPQLIW